VDWDFPVTVEDVVLMGRYGRLGLFGRPSKEDRRAATEALAQMGMEGFARRQISQLSGGQQQRVFLARALAQGGDLLFMDEPFVGVDAATETAILDLLRAIRAKGGTVVVVHHDLHMAREAFDELVLLNRRVIAHGASAEVFTPALLTKAYGGRLTVVDGGEQAKVLIAA
jgi:manganese/zinc/iron transport system ATP- binding protein